MNDTKTDLSCGREPLSGEPVDSAEAPKFYLLERALSPEDAVMFWQLGIAVEAFEPFVLVEVVAIDL